MCQYSSKQFFPPKTVVWKRIRELGKAAVRGWPGLTVHQRSEALMYLNNFKQCHPKKSHPRKKEVNWKCYSQYAPIFALIFACHTHTCNEALIFAMLFAPETIYFYFIFIKIGSEGRCRRGWGGVHRSNSPAKRTHKSTSYGRQL